MNDVKEMILLHTNLHLDQITNTGEFDTYQERFDNLYHHMMFDIIVSMIHCLSFQVALGNLEVGYSWEDGKYVEDDHLPLYLKERKVSEWSKAKSKSNGKWGPKSILGEMLKTRMVDNYAHERKTIKDHKGKLNRPMTIDYGAKFGGVIRSGMFLCYEKYFFSIALYNP